MSRENYSITYTDREGSTQHCRAKSMQDLIHVIKVIEDMHPPVLSCIAIHNKTGEVVYKNPIGKLKDLSPKGDTDTSSTDPSIDFPEYIDSDLFTDSEEEQREDACSFLEDLSRSAAYLILQDLEGRVGFRKILRNLNLDLKQKIKQSWASIVLSHLQYYKKELEK